jgi:hypothetical protein
MTPIFGYKKGYSNVDAYWFGKVKNHDHKFVRCAAGLMMPILDREQGAVVVVAELFSLTKAVDLWLVGQDWGEWKEVRNSMAQFRRDLKFQQIITDKEEARPLIRRMRDVYHGQNEIPVYTDIAPKYALTEIGRSTIDEMFEEGRLHVDEQDLRDIDSPIRLALQCVVCWLRDYPVVYRPSQPTPQGFGHILGIEGL